MAEFRQAKVRQVNTFFWDDPYIEDLCSKGKLLFLYLITTPLTNIAGSFEITLAKMTHHTGLERSEVEDLLKRFEADGKFIYRDKWMLAVNAIEHQNTNNPQIRQGIATIIARSPRWVIDKSCMTHTWLIPPENESSHSYSYSDLNLNSDLNGKASPSPVAATAAVEKDPIERRIWEDGVDLLVHKAKMKDESARPLLGRLAKQYGEESLAIAIAVTMAKNPVEPKAFMIGVLKQRANPSPGANVGKWDGKLGPEPKCSKCFDMGWIEFTTDGDRVLCSCGQPLVTL
jgi:hypothetical protein